MNQSQSIAAVVAASGMSKAEVVKVMDAISDVASTTVKKMDVFVLPGLGRLKAIKREARTGRNPATGETIKIKAKKVVKFAVAKGLKDLVAKAK